MLIKKPVRKRRMKSTAGEHMAVQEKVGLLYKVSIAISAVD